MWYYNEFYGNGESVLSFELRYFLRGDEKIYENKYRNIL